MANIVLNTPDAQFLHTLSVDDLFIYIMEVSGRISDINEAISKLHQALAPGMVNLELNMTPLYDTREYLLCLWGDLSEEVKRRSENANDMIV